MPRGQPRRCIVELEASGPAPCEGCRYARRCAAERLACTAFTAFIACDDWVLRPRAPDAHTYAGIFDAGAHRYEVCA